jgi:hypothetical protein
MAADHTLIIHRGGKSGVPIATTSSPIPAKEGVTEVHFPDASDPLVLEHVHHDFLHLHGTTSFTYNGKKYHWKGHTGLVDDETDTLLALFHSSWFTFDWTKVGRLEITSEGKQILDIAVITALIVQERSDEAKQAVFPCFTLNANYIRGNWRGKRQPRQGFRFSSE